MNNKIIIEVNNYINKFINKCIKNNINLYSINYKSNNKITCLIDFKDYKSLKKINYQSNIKIIKYEGLNGLKKHLKDNIYYYLLIILCFIYMDIITSYIVKIEIIHENTSIRTLIKKELEERDIKPYTLSLSFNELEQIKDSILKDNPNTLEWLSIIKDGMKYIIRAEERIINNQKEDNSPQNIIATKDALITKIIAKNGEVLVRTNDYVKKGDILISGNINLYDEIKGTTKAEGTIYGNVWYEVEIKIPLKKEIVKDTGKHRYNLTINNKLLLKNKYQLFRQENIKEIKILFFKIKIYKEIEYQIITYKLSNKDLDIELNNLLKESFNSKLKGRGTIISQKVLKKKQNNSTIDYRIFVITNEIISTSQKIETGDIFDTSKSY